MGIFSGIGSVVGGLFGGGAPGAAIGGGIGGVADAILNRGDSQRANEDNANLQREFAQQGIRWRVADARAAGLHPLAVLGASGAGASPSYVVGSGGSGIDGQDISRAIDATRTAEERREAAATEFMLARQRESDARVDRERDYQLRAVESASRIATDEAQRALFYAQARKLDQQKGPPMPGGGRNESVSPVGAVKVTPSEITSSSGLGSDVAGIDPMFLRVRMPDGTIARFPNPKLNLDSEIVHAFLGANAYGRQWLGSLENDGLPRGYSQREYRWVPRGPVGRSFGGSMGARPKYPHRKGL